MQNTKSFFKLSTRAYGGSGGFPRRRFRHPGVRLSWGEGRGDRGEYLGMLTDAKDEERRPESEVGSAGGCARGDRSSWWWRRSGASQATGEGRRTFSSASRSCLWRRLPPAGLRVGESRTAGGELAAPVATSCAGDAGRQRLGHMWRPRFLINPNSWSTQLIVVKSRSTWAWSYTRFSSDTAFLFHELC
jgi:hypothetical protein